MIQTRICSCCGKEKPIESYKKVGKRNGGVSVLTICNECMRKKQDEGRAMAKVKKQQKVAQEVVDARTLRLQDFTPRELMTELHRRGYEGVLKFTSVEQIDISNF